MMMRFIENSPEKFVKKGRYFDPDPSLCPLAGKNPFDSPYLYQEDRENTSKILGDRT